MHWFVATRRSTGAAWLWLLLSCAAAGAVSAYGTEPACDGNTSSLSLRELSFQELAFSHRRLAQASVPACAIVAAQKDRPGADIKNINGVSVAQCYTACKAQTNPQCEFFSYGTTTSTTAFNYQRCYMKSIDAASVALVTKTTFDNYDIRSCNTGGGTSPPPPAGIPSCAKPFPKQDRPGNDIISIGGVTEAGCYAACKAQTNPECQFFTYGITAATANICYMKNAADANVTPVPNINFNHWDIRSCLTGGTPPPPPSGVPVCAKPYPKQDRPGNDIVNIVGVSEAGCYDACKTQTNPQCQFFTYGLTTSPSNFNYQRCYMKNAADADVTPVANNNFNHYDIRSCLTGTPPPPPGGGGSGVLIPSAETTLNGVIPACAKSTPVDSDRFGSDLPSQPIMATSAEQCFNICAKNLPCAFFTFKASSNSCWQKSVLLAATPVTAAAGLQNYDIRDCYTRGYVVGGAAPNDEGLHGVLTKPSGPYVLAAGATKATVKIDATGSHTHALSRSLNPPGGYLWNDAATGVPLGTGPILTTNFYGLGQHAVLFTLVDDTLDWLRMPPFPFTVSTSDTAAAVLVKLYNGVTDPVNIPAAATYAFVQDSPATFSVPAVSLPASHSTFILRMVGKMTFPANPTITFSGVNGAATALYIGGVKVTAGAQSRAAGSYGVDFRVAVTTKSTVTLLVNGNPAGPGTADLSVEGPVINALASTGSDIQGGSVGLFTGLLLGGATVTVGSTTVPATSSSNEQVSFVWPNLAAGTVTTLFATVNGKASNKIPVTYFANGGTGGGLGGPFQNTANFVQKTYAEAKIVRSVFCHGKVYVATTNGLINEYTFDSQYNKIATRKIVQLAETSNTILGLACDPWDNDANFKLLFSHSFLYAQTGNGANLKPPYPYYGKISFVRPNSGCPSCIKAVVTNLCVSNHDHSVNNMDFDHSGNLLWANGGNTNAGIPANLIGGLDEGPSCAGVMKAQVRSAGFTPAISYSFLPGAPTSATSTPGGANSEIAAGWVKINGGYVTQLVTGLRNPFGLRVRRNGKLMVSDNGCNSGDWGPEMTGYNAGAKQAISSGVSPYQSDSFWADVGGGCYCGHANVALCRAGLTKSCKWVRKTDSGFPSVGCPPSANLPSATGGVEEYNAWAFNGNLRGNFFIAGYTNQLWRYTGSGAPTAAGSTGGTFPNNVGTDVVQAPGGVLLVSDYNSGHLNVNIPSDAVLAANKNPSLYDISPYKAAKTQSGANTFVIGGANFQYITGAVTVKFGGVAATNVQVKGPAWITGNIPSNAAGTCSPGTAITVSFGTKTLTLPDSFCYLNDVGAFINN